MREKTWNLAEGFDKVRWDDDIETVRSFYPGARERRERIGVDPETGERIVRKAGLHMRQPAFAVPVPAAGLELGLSVGFDDRGVSDIAFTSHGGNERYGEASKEEWMEVVSSYVEKTARELGLEPFEPNQMEQDWDLDGVHVALSLEWDGFMFRFERSRP